MISLDQKYMTRHGNSVRLLCDNRAGSYPIVGLIAKGGQEYLGTWTKDGANFHSVSDDLLPVKKPDVVLYGMIQPVSENKVKIATVFADNRKLNSDTCMFIFDGETGALKDAQVLVKES